jgi:SAM-dependent methyltransferase
MPSLITHPSTPTTSPIASPNLARRLLPPGLYRRACKFYDRLRSAAFFVGSLGFARKCPFCGLTWRRFVPYPGAASPLFEQEHVVGGGPFEHSECPWCGSFERERHVYLYLRDQTNVLFRPVSMLHIAPERCLQKVLRRHQCIDYLSADLSSPRAELKCDLTRLPIDDNRYDVILCNHVLEHIPDDRAAMRELFRVLKPDGWAMLQVPLAVSRAETEEDLSIDNDAERLLRYGQRDHVRLYGRDYADRLASVGFEVERHDTRSQFGDGYARRFALIPDEVIYIARKPA